MGTIIETIDFQHSNIIAPESIGIPVITARIMGYNT